MILDRASIVRVGQALNACYAPFFLDRPERAVFAIAPGLIAKHLVIWGTDRDGPRPYGAIYFDAVLGAWIVAIRGTDSIPEWLSDATALLVECPFLAGTKTHQGFTEIYETLVTDGFSLRAHLVDHTRPIIITGHSLGAALATLVATAVGGCDLVTFAGPRVGDDAFAHLAMSRLASNVRVVNTRDIVPNLPLPLPEFPFAHLGVATEIDSEGQVATGPRCAHNLVTYLHGLDPDIPVEAQCAPAAP